MRNAEKIVSVCHHEVRIYFTDLLKNTQREKKEQQMPKPAVLHFIVFWTVRGERERERERERVTFVLHSLKLYSIALEKQKTKRQLNIAMLHSIHKLCMAVLLVWIAK